MQVVINFIQENPNMSMFLMTLIGVILQRYMPGIVPFLGDVKKTSDELAKLAHYHTPINTNEIKQKALNEGLKLAAKALDSEIVKEQKKKIKNQLGF